MLIFLGSLFSADLAGQAIVTEPSADRAISVLSNFMVSLLFPISKRDCLTVREAAFPVSSGYFLERLLQCRDRRRAGGVVVHVVQHLVERFGAHRAVIPDHNDRAKQLADIDHS